MQCFSCCWLLCDMRLLHWLLLGRFLDGIVSRMMCAIVFHIYGRCKGGSKLKIEMPMLIVICILSLHVAFAAATPSLKHVYPLCAHNGGTIGIHYGAICIHQPWNLTKQRVSCHNQSCVTDSSSNPLNQPWNDNRGITFSDGPHRPHRCAAAQRQEELLQLSLRALRFDSILSAQHKAVTWWNTGALPVARASQVRKVSLHW